MKSKKELSALIVEGSRTNLIGRDRLIKVKLDWKKFHADKKRNLDKVVEVKFEKLVSTQKCLKMA